MPTDKIEQLKARAIISASLARLNGQLNSSQNPQIVIGYRSGPSMIDFVQNPGGEVGHVEIGIRENGKVTWFGFSPNTEAGLADGLAGGIATALGTPGQFKVEGGLPPFGGPGVKLVHCRSEGPPDFGPAER